MIKKVLTVLFFALSLLPSMGQVNIIPRPAIVEEGSGSFQLSPQTVVISKGKGKGASRVAQAFIEKLQTSTGVRLKSSHKAATSSILFAIDPTIKGKEAYLLEVTPQQVKLSASSENGLFWAYQSLLQLLPPFVESTNARTPNWPLKIPMVRIEDQPRFSWRGTLVDVSRHFMPVAAIKKQLDIMASLKLNRFHWHLTDDQGWRIEIKRYPKLTDVGAWRIDAEGNKYGGFYTQQEIREIVAYAAARHIEVVPELEIPGHELAAIAAYPDLSCNKEEITPRIIWGVEDIVMCPGRENMFNFLNNVIDELVPLFPSTYFHIGGDESPRIEWEKCDSCQARMKVLGLTREAQLQDYVIERIGKYLQTKGKRIIGWDEILEGGNLPKDAIVMSWRGEEGGIIAAQKRHSVIMTPGSHGLYFDHYQGDFMNEPTSIGGYAPLEKCYAYNPVPSTLSTQGLDSLVLGVQGNNWTEYTLGPAALENRLWPRGAALAEVGWTKESNKDFSDFQRRLDNDFTLRLKERHINFYIPAPSVEGISSNKLAFIHSRTVALTSQRNLPIVYTLDGTTPTAHSTRYAGPIKIDQNTTLNTATLLPCGLLSNVRKIEINKQTPLFALSTPTIKGYIIRKYKGEYRTPQQLKNAKADSTFKADRIEVVRTLTNVPSDVRNVKNYAATAEGFFYVPETGVYEFSSLLTQVSIDGTLYIDNSGVYAPRDTRENCEIALAKGWHKIHALFLGGIFGGWPTYWNDVKIQWRLVGGKWNAL
ncbi:hypothetical protein HMPREF9332_00123 [Alloprevotella rava F0323]|uniref:beta-N-acetylhexosaminidase n=1 Tax=Alloprevotella rava F0323 TaxID=679199 RepID=G5G972_9BACT|nr:family 20 glycosylhydrolase [Alloprevotella rava]EHG24648.1 hypothetical protein HMPREF9332_00123 [Alloprevotella rava F0323]